jgi:hypothetical protein
MSTCAEEVNLHINIVTWVLFTQAMEIDNHSASLDNLLSRDKYLDLQNLDALKGM